jgi:membrane fusion protein, multidrug efflux system
MASERERPTTSPDAPYPPARSDQPRDGAPRHHPAEPAAPPAGRRRRGHKWVWLALAALAAIAVYYELHPAGPPVPQGRPGEPPASITAGKTRRGDINVYIEALGTVTPVYTVNVYSQVTGRLLNVYYQQGQMVHRGDALLDIDPRPYQAQLTQAEGVLQRDEGLLAQARMDLARYRAAYAKNAIAAQQVEDQAQLVGQYEGSVKSDQGAVEYNQAQLAYCHIVSPITGRVGLRLVDPGNTIFAGTGSTLVLITQVQPITVVFTVSEDALPQVEAQLRAGHALAVDAFDRSNTKLLASGRLGSLNNEVDTTTGTVKFRADFSNANLALFPNQFVNARLRLKTLRSVTLAPSAAVQYNGTNSFVYVVEANRTVKVQPVTTLANNDAETAVTGVNPGVEVATSGFDRLENGVRVVVRAQGAPGEKKAEEKKEEKKGEKKEKKAR